MKPAGKAFFRALLISAAGLLLLRLGSWDRCPGDDGAASRDADVPTFRHPFLGFRVARGRRSGAPDRDFSSR